MKKQIKTSNKQSNLTLKGTRKRTKPEVSRKKAITKISGNKSEQTIEKSNESKS